MSKKELTKDQLIQQFVFQKAQESKDPFVKEALANLCRVVEYTYVDEFRSKFGK